MIEAAYFRSRCVRSGSFESHVFIVVVIFAVIMSGVEPSAEQVALLKADGKLTAALRWAKVSDAIATTIIEVMGCDAEEDMSTAAAVTTDEVETMLTAISVPGDGGVGRPLTIAEKARLRIGFTACRITCGIQTPSDVQRHWADKAAASSSAFPATASTTNTIAALKDGACPK